MTILSSAVIFLHISPWWRHQMGTFSALLAICVGNTRVPGEFQTQRPVTRSFDGFFDLRLNKRLSKQCWGWWFETLSCPLWRHCNDYPRVISNHDTDCSSHRNWHCGQNVHGELSQYHGRQELVYSMWTIKWMLSDEARIQDISNNGKDYMRSISPWLLWWMMRGVSFLCHLILKKW